MQALIEGTVDALPVRSGGKIKLIVKNITVDGEKFKGRAYASLSADCDYGIGQGAVLLYGDFFGRELGLSAAGIRVYDYNDRIYYDINASSVDYIKRVFDPAARFRDAVYTGMTRYMPGDTAGIAYALLFGDKSEFDAAAIRTYEKTGLLHLFAVSGLHIGFLYALLNFILGKMKIRGGVKNAALCAVFAVYAYLCDFSPSVMRASIMIAVALLAKLSGRRNDPLNTLCFAAVIILAINPLFIFDVGFLLSFSTVFGIVTFYKKINLCFLRGTAKLLNAGAKRRRGERKAENNRDSKRLPKLAVSVINAFSITLCANLGAFPLLCLYFNGVPLSAIPANLIVVPIVSVLFPFTLLTAVLGVPLRFVHILFAVTDRVIFLLNGIVELLSGISVGFYINFNAFSAFLYYLFLIYLSDFYMGKRLNVKKRIVDFINKKRSLK